MIKVVTTYQLIYKNKHLSKWVTFLHIYIVKCKTKRKDMKKYNKPITLTVTNLLLFSTLAIAEPQFNLKEERTALSNKIFNHYDNNKDKILSLDEFNSFTNEMKQKENLKHVENTLKSCDKNTNGKIELSEIFTEKEMEESFKQGEQAINQICYIDKMEFNRINKDEDEFITKEEILLSFTEPTLGMWEDTPPEMLKSDELKEFKERLENCDKNRDRELTLIEATSNICYMSSELFLKYSTDPEKSFSIDEVTKAPNERKLEIEHKFKHCDDNSDNKLSMVEATSMFCNIQSDEFIKMDSDNNKYLSKDEIKKMYDKELNGDNMVPVKISKEMPPIIQVSIAINQCDENKDRKLTKDEAETCELPIKTFEKYDYDKSNSIEENDMKMMQTVEEFNRVDTNKNKKLEAKEFQEYMGNREF